MKRRILSIPIAFSLILSISPLTTYAQNDPSIIVNGETVDLETSLLMENDRLLVPMNGVFDKIEAEVTWEKEKNIVYIEDNYTLVELDINNKNAMIHKKYDFTGIPQEVELEVAPRVVGDTVFIPLRFVAESLEAKVGWDSNSGSVTINSKRDSDAVNYMIVSDEEIFGNTGLSKWYEENKLSKGIYSTKLNNNTYILISAGQKNTGGYSVSVTGVVYTKPNELYVFACVENPLSDAIVTQVISYPCVVLKVSDTELKNISGTIY